MKPATYPLLLLFTITLLSHKSAAQVVEDPWYRAEISWCAQHDLMSAVEEYGFEYTSRSSMSGDWYYVLFPTVSRDYEDWPFFFLSEHSRYWGPAENCPGGCTAGGWSGVGANRLILNTQPYAWDIRWELDQVIISRGSDFVMDYIQFDKDIHTESNPLIFEYADKSDVNEVVTQKGKVRIFFENDAMNVVLEDVRYDDYPRTCQRGTKAGKECGMYQCDGEVLRIQSTLGGSTKFSAPSCLRNILGGVSGRYIGEDCTEQDVADPTNKCSDILLGPDGTAYMPDDFSDFVDTWGQPEVEQYVEDEGHTLPEFINWL